MDKHTWDGLISDWLEDNTIKRFKLTTVKSRALELWAEEALSILEGYHSPDPYLLIHDISAQAVGSLVSLRGQIDVMHPALTINGQAQVNKILKSRPKLHVRLAVIVSQALSGQFVYRRSTATLALLPNLEVKAFFTQEAAIEWLKAAPNLLGPLEPDEDEDEAVSSSPVS